jgi:hypothetical protein
METAPPKLLEEIAGLIGDAATLKVVARWGGRTIDFSAVRHDLAGLIGTDGARLLDAHFHRVPVYIPSCQAKLREVRNAALRERFDTLSKTHSARRVVALLVGEFHITERHVWRLLKTA